MGGAALGPCLCFFLLGGAIGLIETFCGTCATSSGSSSSAFRLFLLRPGKQVAPSSSTSMSSITVTILLPLLLREGWTRCGGGRSLAWCRDCWSRLAGAEIRIFSAVVSAETGLGAANKSVAATTMGLEFSARVMTLTANVLRAKNTHLLTLYFGLWSLERIP